MPLLLTYRRFRANSQVERIFMMLAVPTDSYGLRHASDPSFFEGRCAEIYLKKSGQVVGLFGTVHTRSAGGARQLRPALPDLGRGD